MMNDADGFIDLLRHGEVSGGISRLRGVTDDPLSLQGNTQMWRSVGSDHPWDRVVSSPLKRCRSFAESIASLAGIPLEITPLLRELDFGDWEGLEIEAVWNMDPELASAFWENPFAMTPPHGEAPLQLKKRVLQAWEWLRESFRGEHVLVVSHGGPIRILLGQVLNMSDSAVNRIEVPLASLSRVRVPSGDWPPSLMFHRGACRT